jgi:hypothetical protein
MKKRILAFLLAASLVLTGCNLLKTEPKTVSLEGVLTEQSSTDEHKGTHLLTADDGLVTPLNSLNINLSAPQYLNNKVKVTGIVDETTKVLEVSGVVVIEVLSKAQGQGELTEYKNEELGFQLKYYNNWEVKENNTGAGIEEKNPSVTFLSPEAPAPTGTADSDTVDDTAADTSAQKFERSQIIVSQFPFEYVPTPKQDPAAETVTTMDTPLEAYFKGDISKQLRKIGPDMMDAVEMPDDCGGTNYYVYRSGFIYELSFVCDLKNPNRIEMLKVFDEMVSTFQFMPITGTDDTSDDISDDTVTSDDTATSDNTVSGNLPAANLDLAEFQSTSFGFKALYPKKWYYEGKNTLENGILYHYGFSDKAMDNGGIELVGLDLMSGEMPTGTSLTPYGINGVEVKSGDNVYIYVQGVNRIYRLKGAKTYENLMLNMAKGIAKLEV